MLIYILVALFPLLVGLLFDTKVAVGIPEDAAQTKKMKIRRWWWLLIAATPMFALIAFRRPDIGADTGVYLKFFSKMVETPWKSIFVVNQAGPQFEVGFVVFEKLLTYVTHSPQIYQIICASIYLVSIVSFAHEIDRYGFSFLYFFATMGVYTFMFTGVRQCLAMCICLLSYGFVKKRKFIPYVILLLLAFSFHISAMFFVPVYFIYNRKFNFINCFIYVLGIAVIFLTRNFWNEWFMEKFEFNADQAANGSGFIFFLVMCCVTAISIFTLVVPKKLDSKSLGYFNVNLIAWLFWLLRIFTLAAERPAFYFMFFSAAMLCYALDAPTKSRDRIIYKVLVYSLFMLLFVYRMLTSHASLVPYSTFF